MSEDKLVPKAIVNFINGSKEFTLLSGVDYVDFTSFMNKCSEEGKLVSYKAYDENGNCILDVRHEEPEESCCLYDTAVVRYVYLDEECKRTFTLSNNSRVNEYLSFLIKCKENYTLKGYAEYNPDGVCIECQSFELGGYDDSNK